MILGCIGDDFTGSSDLGLTLACEGMQTVQYCGVPTRDAAADVDAGVVALKSRTCPVEEAVRDSLAALVWLRRQGCQQFVFKYCSTFDSTPEGNIGPVTDALMAALGTDRTIVCPAFPRTGRRVFQGHLFVHDRLLNESGMESHPLTPMSDPDIRRWLARQTRHAVGHVGYEAVGAGADAIRAAVDREVAAGRPVVVVDAILERDLRQIGSACAGLALITGGSGIARGLPANFGAAHDAAPEGAWSGVAGPGVVLSGSCSTATRGQVARYAAAHPALGIDPVELLSGVRTVEALVDWAIANLPAAPMVYSTAAPEAVRAVQTARGSAAVARAVEEMFAEVARRLAAHGVRRFVVAGGETSSAVTTALRVESLHIGPEIAPGVPALRDTDRDLVLALKSGNFGDPDFFETAMQILGETR
jgi:uncharacterized protein YgbK (DUF1537 family)